MGIFGKKTQKALLEAQTALKKVQDLIEEDIQALQTRQTASEARLEKLERQTVNTADIILTLEKKIDNIRDSAIRGEISSGQKSKDVAEKFGLTASRIAQIAPRRKYNNG